jgi:hypothetical protein
MLVAEVRIQDERGDELLLLPVEEVDEADDHYATVGDHYWREVWGVIREATEAEAAEAQRNLDLLDRRAEEEAEAAIDCFMEMLNQRDEEELRALEAELQELGL